MINKYGLEKEIYFKICEILNLYKDSIDNVILYGSRSRNDYKVTSDIDLAVKYKKDSEQVHNKIKQQLEQSNIVYTIDLLNYNLIKNDRLKQQIDIEGKIIFTSDKLKGELLMSQKILSYKLQDYENALARLEECFEKDYEKDLMVLDATIQRFEFTYELAWKLMKKYLEYVGNTELVNPRSTIRESFKELIIEDANVWFDMIESRNMTSHVYDYELSKEIYHDIKNKYLQEFKKMKEKIKNKIENI